LPFGKGLAGDVLCKDFIDEASHFYLSLRGNGINPLGNVLTDSDRERTLWLSGTSFNNERF